MINNFIETINPFNYKYKSISISDEKYIDVGTQTTEDEYIQYECNYQTYYQHFYQMIIYSSISIKASFYFFLHAIFPNYFTQRGFVTIHSLLPLFHKNNEMIILLV